MMPLFSKTRNSKFVTLPQNLLTAAGTLYEDFETIGDWTIDDLYKLTLGPVRVRKVR